MSDSSTTSVLRDNLTGVHNDMWQAMRPPVVDALPFKELKSDVGEYNIINREGGLLPREEDIPSTIAGYEDSFEDAKFEYGKGTMRTFVRLGKRVFFPEEFVRVMQGNNPDLDPILDAVKFNDGLAACRIVRDFQTVGNALSATAVESGTLALTTQTLDYGGILERIWEESDLAGQAIDTFVVGPQAARLMAGLNFFRRELGFAGGSASLRAGNDRPSRADMWTELKAAHLAATGIRLVVDGTKRASISGGVNVGAYEFTTTGYFLCTENVSNATVVLAGDSRNGLGLIEYLTDRASLAANKTPGQYSSWIGRWGFNRVVSNPGKKATLTLA
jgi:hypothetical protein